MSNHHIVELEDPPGTDLEVLADDPLIVKGNSNDEDTSLVPMASGRSFYAGDVVMKKEFPQNQEWIPSFGTVTSPQAAEIDDGGSSSSSVLVRWEATNKIENLPGPQLCLVDRLLLRNMKVSNKLGNVGIVSNVKVLSTVQIIGTNHVVERVSLDRLLPISAFVRGQEILYKNWIGIVTTIKRNVWFKLRRGMGFYIESIENDGFMRNDPYWGVGIPCPGIRTKLSASTMKSAKWVSGPMKFLSRWIPPLSYLYSMSQCTITRTEVTGIDVTWLQVIPGVANVEHLQPPETRLTRDKLALVTVIGTPSSETVGIHSIRMLKLRPEDSMTSFGNWREGFEKTFMKEEHAYSPKHTLLPEVASLKALAAERVFEVPVKVLHRQSIVDVSWENGTVERLHSLKVPFIVPMKQDSEYPQGMVVAPLFDNSPLVDLYGVILGSCKGDDSSRMTRKAYVKWIVNGVPSSTTEESTLDLQPHPIYSLYQRGTILFPRDPDGVTFKSAVVSDLNIAAGKMVVVVTEDNSQHEVYPHMVIPLPKRCFWDFFTRKWEIDEILPPPYQLICEYHPAKKYAAVSTSRTNILINKNNNPVETVTPASLWDEPSFELLGFAPETHRYHRSGVGIHGFSPKFIQTIQKEFHVMKDSIPEGIWVRSYENRMDLMSVLMLGPTGTPFEDGIFLFDLHLTADFPSKPPMVHYVSYTFEISPMLSWDGNFCGSAMDWKFREEPESYIVNCLAQIQGIVFAKEPYFSDNRWPDEKGTQRGQEFSRMYSEQTFLRVLDSGWNMIHNPPDPWAAMIKSHFIAVLPEKLATIEKWNLFTHMDSSISGTAEMEEETKPEFQLIPVSDGFKHSLNKRLAMFRTILQMNVQGNVSRPSSKAGSVVDSTADSESVPVDVQSTSEKAFELDLEPSKLWTENVHDNDIVIKLRDSDIDESPSPSLLLPSFYKTKKGKLGQGIDFQKNVIQGKNFCKKGRKQFNKPDRSSASSASASVCSDSESEVENKSKIPDIIEEEV